MGHQKEKAKGGKSFGFWKICSPGTATKQDSFCLFWAICQAILRPSGDGFFASKEVER